jgi:hypothetical protein
MSVNQHKHGDAKTREQLKKVKKEQNVEEVQDKPKRIRVRLIPIWLRIVLFLLLIVLSVSAGAMVGYGVLGDGKPTDVFNQSTWTHIKDLVDKEK